MLGSTCMIHLGIQWPRIQCSRAYAKHQHGTLWSLWPIFSIIFSFFLEIYTQHKCKYSCSPEPLAQHKTSHRSCASRSTPNTNKHIYIINNCLTPNIYNKSSCSYVVGSSTQYKNKTSRLSS